MTTDMAAAIVTCSNCGKRNRVAAVGEGVPRCAVCKAHLPWIVDIDPAELDAAVSASVPVLVELWAPWCGPCKWVAPVVERLARDHAGHLKVLKLNIDDAPAIADRYGVRAVPTLLLLRDGQEIDRLAGAAPQPQLEAWLQPHLDAAASAAQT
jgi:thioredoxin 2